MTNAPSDLLAFRNTFMTLTGLSDPNEVGIVGDAAHAAKGGYHIGVDDIVHAGQFTVEYSTKNARDQLRGTNFASALDLGDNWPNGGRAAWLRFNNAMLSLIVTGYPPLLPLRAMNFTPDGTALRRYDTAHRDQGVIASNDTVNIHTHLEFWRDTIGNRHDCLAIILDVAEAAIRNVPLEAVLLDYSPATATALAIGATDKGFVDGGENTVPWDASLRTYNLRRLILGSETDEPATAVNQYSLKALHAKVDQALATLGTPANVTISDAALSELAQKIAAINDPSKVEAALRNVLLKGVQPDAG